ncbi:hypothetical protein J4771_00900 [Candidatus Kaistella beijingensis]|uniref:contact-dependent growth inhibition system immunity protein n=1 Tax=Candidatus Kaistella beijingensis TaxID=2820270 RepID=UPI001CC78BC5|nr:contact-dependent growth inhibition system immunity protein [Candidatus Kaistella beijingensis]UBB89941.1 hypothetical protein J4771_00900 [Candidatus Kaistella beijingensis]
MKKNSKLEPNYKYKNLENLEKDFWGEPKYESYLVKTCHKLRKKIINEFSIEDLRIMIGQNIGLKYLIPSAIEILNQNIIAEGDFYEGDLLKSVLTSEIDYWKNNKDNWNKIIEIITKKEELLKSFETTKEIRMEIFESIERFKKL